MKTLLIHSNNSRTSEQVKEWKSKRETVGKFFQQPIEGDLDEILESGEHSKLESMEEYLKKAIEKFGIKKVFLFLNEVYEEFPENPLQDKFSELKFMYIINHQPTVKRDMLY